MKHFTKKAKLITGMMAVVFLLSNCASTTYIDSYPSGADLYLDGEAVGQTPYPMTDTKLMFTCTSVRIEKEDYRPFHTTICRDEEADVGAIIGGFICTVPFLWAMKYKPTHFYKLLENEGNEKSDDSFDTLIKKESNKEKEE